MQTSHLSGTGKRNHNEDNYLIIEDRHIYIVCDGVGGAAKGEVASRLCCDSFKDFFSGKKGVVTEENIQEATRAAEKAFDAYLEKHPEATGMGTTLAFLAVHDDTAIIAHAGDSRIYHVRDGKIVFVTHDHSLVNELLASGFIKPEEAPNHPKKNQITRAIQGSHSAVKTEVKELKGIMPGDFFLLCSDGILESVSPQFIEQEFRQMTDPEKLKKKIADLCAANSKDNYTCIIIKIDKQAAAVPAKRPADIPANKNAKPKNRNKFTWFLLIIVLLAAGYFGYTEWKKRKDAGTKNEHKNNKKKPGTGSSQGNTIDDLNKKNSLAPGNTGQSIPVDPHKISGPAIDGEKELFKYKGKDKTPPKERMPDDIQIKTNPKPMVPPMPEPVIPSDTNHRTPNNSLY